MAQCLNPYKIKERGISVPCGYCLECKGRRVAGWSFRLMKESEVSTSSLFVTLTYTSDKIPILPNGQTTLCKKDLQDFFKRLRKNQKARIKYYACGEYGGHTWRPHYHIIMFNASNRDAIETAWGNGSIHVGKVNELTTQYTLKYISKNGKIPAFNGDLRQREFSLMSKKMGMSYLSRNMKKWHKADLLNRMYCPGLDNIKVPMPRYYKEKIYTRIQRQKIANSVIGKIDLERSKLTPKLCEEKDIQDNLIRMEKGRKNRENRINLKI